MRAERLPEAVRMERCLDRELKVVQIMGGIRGHTEPPGSRFGSL